MKKSLKEVLAPMTKAEKIKYIWHYYRFHILGLIAVIIFATFTINGIVNKKDSVLNLMIVGEKIDNTKVEELVEQFNKDLLMEEDRNSAEIGMQAVTYSTTEMDPQMQVGLQKLAAELAAGAVDILIVDKAYYDEMNVDGQLLDIKEISSIENLPYDNDQMYVSEEDKVTGIDLSALPLFEGVTFDENIVLCLPANSKNDEYIRDFLKYMINLN
ncbi:hypothetical protein [Bacillus sp. FSL K6-3431]|uniref:hypothetical protein n=1 Tax=Bacillus sp. FSL K6-3431 TaxID=2921500 RepID=UPI0030F6FD53